MSLERRTRLDSMHQKYPSGCSAEEGGEWRNQTVNMWAEIKPKKALEQEQFGR